MTDTVSASMKIAGAKAAEGFGVILSFEQTAAIYRAMLAASPQGAVPTKREAALADLAKLDGETMDLERKPQWLTHDGGPNPVPGQRVVWQNRQGDSECCKADDLNGWEHPNGPDGRWDIIAYRVTEGVKP